MRSKVVHALDGFGDAAADGSAGIVDEDIRAAVLLQHPFCQRGALIGVGDIGGAGDEAQAEGGGLLFGGFELDWIARGDQNLGAGLRELERRRLADARGAARDEHNLAFDLRPERLAGDEVRIEMALPVVPKFPRIVFEARHVDARRFEQARGFAIIEAGGVVQKGEDGVRKLQIAHDGGAQALQHGERSQPFDERRGQQAKQAQIEAHADAGRVAGLGEQVEHVAHAVGMRIGEVEALAVLPGRVRDVAGGGHDEIDGDQVDAPAFDPNQGHPGGHDGAYLLDQAEEVVRPVDLIHLAGSGVANNDAGPVNPPGHTALLAHNFLGLVLAREIGVIEVPGLLEHILAEGALIEPRRRDGTEMVEPARADGFRQRHGIARALDICRHLHFRIGAEVVDRGQMKEMIDLAFQGFDIAARKAEPRLADVALERDGALCARVPVFAQRFDALRGRVAHQEIDGGVTPLQKRPHQPLADKSAGAGDEINHVKLPSVAGVIP